MRAGLLTVMLGIALLGAFSTAQAQETCQTWYDPATDSLIMICFGGGENEQPPPECLPGVHLVFIVLEVSGPGECIGVPVYVDNCTGEMLAYASEYERMKWHAIKPELKADIAFLDKQVTGYWEVLSQSKDGNLWTLWIDNTGEPEETIFKS